MLRVEWEEVNRRYRRYIDFGAEGSEVSWLLRKLGQFLKETEPEPDPDVWDWVRDLCKTDWETVRDLSNTSEEDGSDEGVTGGNRGYRIPRMGRTR